MGDHFYYGQKDLIRQLNQLALAKDIIDIPQNSAAAAASAASAASAAATAAQSNGAAAISATAAAASFRALDARYLGAKALPPALDNAGGALLAGATYWDTVLNGGCLRVFQAGAWVTIPANVASQISSTPVGGIVAANVQAALAELDTKKAARATTLAGYGITDALSSTYTPTWVSITGKPQFAAVATSGSKGDVGLSRVDNTSDEEKPVSTAQSTALGLKAPVNNPVFTGVVRNPAGGMDFGTGGCGIYSPNVNVLSIVTNGAGSVTVSPAGVALTGVVSGITKPMVGLGNVDNTSDAEKPVSTAQSTALGLKAPANNPVFTGIVRIPASGMDFGTNGTGIGAPAAGMLAMTANGVERFRISNTGDVTFTNVPKITASSAATCEIITQGQNGYGVFSAKSSAQLPSIWDSYNANGLCGRILCDNAAANSTFTFSMRKDGVMADVLGINRGQIFPTIDGTTALGGASQRWSVVFSSTGAINTSDARLKTAIRPMDEAEISAAIAIAESVGTYKWLESIQAKGSDARRHVGATVQGIMAIMEQNGLDPFEYGFICFDSWDEEYSHRPPVDGEGGGEVLVREAGDLYSLRNDQLNLFIARGLMARMAKTEALHAALESRLAALETT
ncbi:tail fiber domain-containing protein [Janthinobacterium sp. RB2P8]|uniref:tail fiber domain-containing protein n=1 Tax=Janthinobacterium sp. RB2P8 TaxID=3424191 RepID=UPI003F234A3A